MTLSSIPRHSGNRGFSTKQASVGAYNSTYIHVVIGVFMILSGFNYSLHYALYKGKWKDVLKIVN